MSACGEGLVVEGDTLDESSDNVLVTDLANMSLACVLDNDVNISDGTDAMKEGGTSFNRVLYISLLLIWNAPLK